MSSLAFYSDTIVPMKISRYHFFCLQYYMLYIYFLDTQYDFQYAAFKLKFTSFILNNSNTMVQAGNIFWYIGNRDTEMI